MIMNKILFKLTERLRCRIIKVNDQPYLERYYISKNIFLHRFISGDGDRHIHDHPWKWAFSIILTGYYTEQLLGHMPLVKRRWFNWIYGWDYHRIIKVKPGTWTLFIHGERFKSWGYLNDDGTYTSASNDNKPTNRESLPLGRDADRVPLAIDDGCDTEDHF